MKQIQQNKNDKKNTSLKVMLLVSVALVVVLTYKYSSLVKERFFTQHSIEQTSKSKTESEEKISKEIFHKTPSESHREILNEPKQKPTFQSMLADQAELRLQSFVTYDGRYEKIAYPMGDVPADIGVCTDVVIRSYRALGIDLQQNVHEDMKLNFRAYPTKWRLKRPDTNIDHRRVPNLMTYFKRAGASLPISEDPYDYKQGHIVTWDLGEGLVHIGIMSDKLSMITGHPLVIHNIGAGPEMSDILFRYKITGHYKYSKNIQ